MLHQDSLREKGHLIVEAFVARDRSTLEQVERVDDARDSFGNTPLHVAVRTAPEWRRYDPVPLLIEKTKDLNCVNDAGRTVLFEAVRGGNRGDVEKLLDAGCDMHIADDYGHTPAHVAAILSGASSPAGAAGARELWCRLRPQRL
jgi:ankyrin repeat protein